MNKEHDLQITLLNGSYQKSKECLIDKTVLDLNKKSKKSNRWITCNLCGKTITKHSMVRHFFAFHGESIA